MRAHEIAIDEADTRSKYAREINQQFKQAGYRKIGSGVDAAIWAKDAGSVVKVLMPDDDNSQAAASYRTFYEYCHANAGNPFLPKFGETKVISVLGREYEQYVMERLKPLRKNTVTELMVWMLSDLVVNHNTWSAAQGELIAGDAWELAEIPPALEQQIQQALRDPQVLARYEQLFNTMRDLFEIGSSRGYGWDLHTENVMQRTDGTPVIIDPWTNF